MIYSKKEREIIKNRIVELLKENNEMNFANISDIIISEGLARTNHIISNTLQREKEYFTNIGRGVWKLIEK